MVRFTSLISSCTLAVAIGMGSLAFSQPATAAPAAQTVREAVRASSAPVESVRWVRRCRMERVARRDRRGHPVRVTREVCRRVWVGPPRRY